MSVFKYRSVEDMPDPDRAASPVEGLRAACEMGRASELFGHSIVGPRGVHKFRSVKEADAHRRQWSQPSRR